MSFFYIYDNNYNLKYANSEPIYAIDLITEEESFKLRPKENVGIN